MRRRSQLTSVQIFVTGAVLLPTVTNVMASELPGTWRPYLWLAWPLTAVLTVLLAIAELRKLRSTEAEYGLGGSPDSALPSVLLYESDTEDPAFASWTLFAEHCVRGLATP